MIQSIITDALEGRAGTINIWESIFTSLRLTEDINELAGRKRDPTEPVIRLNETLTTYEMEISGEKRKLMTNSKDPAKTRVAVSGQQLETVKQS